MHDIVHVHLSLVCTLRYVCAGSVRHLETVTGAHRMTCVSISQSAVPECTLDHYPAVRAVLVYLTRPALPYTSQVVLYYRVVSISGIVYYIHVHENIREPQLPRLRTAFIAQYV